MFKKHTLLLLIIISVISCKTKYDHSQISLKTINIEDAYPIILVNEKQPSRFKKKDSTTILYPLRIEINNNTGADLNYGIACLYDPYQNYTDLLFFEKEGVLIYGRNYFRNNRMVIKNNSKENHLLYVEMLVPNESIEYLTEVKKELEISDKIFKSYSVKSLKPINKKWLNFRNNLITVGINNNSKEVLLVYCLDKGKYVIREKEYMNKNWEQKYSCEEIDI